MFLKFQTYNVNQELHYIWQSMPGQHPWYIKFSPAAVLYKALSILAPLPLLFLIWKQHIQSFCRSVVLYLSISIALLTVWAFQQRSRPQQLTLCQSWHARALQATVSEELAQGPYVAARVGFEPTTRWSKGIQLYQCATTPNSCSSTAIVRNCNWPAQVTFSPF